MRTTVITLAVPVLALLASGALADRFEAQKRERIAQCRAIPANDYSTGMIFNPPGYATLFHRSRCFQDLARNERDPALCTEAVERTSWFFDGSGVSPGACRTLVAQRVAQDREALAAKDFRTLHRLASARFVNNGNGRDFDLLVTTAGTYSAVYGLDVQLSPPGSGRWTSIHQKSYGQGAAAANLRIWLQASALASELGPAYREAPWTARVTWQLEKTSSNRFYYDEIPEDLRASRLEFPVTFSDLPAP